MRQAKGLRSPATSQVEYTDAERQFMLAMDRYKRSNRRPYPTWREVLKVLESLGYRQVDEPGELPEFVRGNR